MSLTDSSPKESLCIPELKTGQQVVSSDSLHCGLYTHRPERPASVSQACILPARLRRLRSGYRRAASSFRRGHTRQHERHCRLQYERGSDVDGDVRNGFVYRDRDLSGAGEGELLQVGADG